MHTGNSLGALSPFHAVLFKVSNAAGTFIEQKPFFASVAYFMILKLLLDYLFVLELFLVRSRVLSYACHHRVDLLFPQIIVCIFILFVFAFLITVIPALIGVITWNSANKQ